MISFIATILCFILNVSSAEICTDDYANDLKRGHEEMVKIAEYHVITRMVLLNQGTPEEAKQNIRQYFTDTFDLDTSLFAHIKPEYLWSRGDPLRHPVCWYAGHSASFYINKLRIAGAIKEPHNDYFESTFAVGVDEMSWDDKLEDRDDWPLPSEIFLYRSEVRNIVLNIIITSSLSLPIKWNSVFYTILMGIAHERIHIETSSVLIRQLPIYVFFNLNDINIDTPWDNTCKIGVYSQCKNDVITFKPSLGTQNHSQINELIAVNGKYVTYGRKIDDFSHNLAVFGWDNEFGEMAVDVPDFNASKYLVSNEEYYQFVLANGYLNKEYWTDEGWRWVQSTKSTKPKFWVIHNQTYYLRNMLNEIPLPWNWPVITNHLEALAFTRWKSISLNKSIRLLTEDEWHVLRQLGEFGDIDQPHWDIAPGNINLEYYASECPIDMFPFGSTGFYDIIGNLWQHTLTPQHPFTGFEVHAYYDDFTTPCFGPHHNIIKGGSWISTGNEAIALSRYQFRRHFFQYAGIRYVESNRDLSYLQSLAERNPYDDDDMVNLYSHFHYSTETYFGVDNYAKKIAEIGIKYSNHTNKLRAIDIGCATGRTAFELTAGFDYVVGLDFTARLIGVAYRMQENGFLEWKSREQGDIKKYYRVTAKELGFSNTLQKVYFIQNDAQNMNPSLNNFDLIIASNLIDRLSNPLLFLNYIHERIIISGIFLLCDPYSWSEIYTAKMNWIGAKNETYSEKEIKNLLLSKNIINNRINWKLIDEVNVQFVIKETKRVFQHVVTHCIVLERI